MSSSQLLNSTFNRICVFTEKCGFKIRNMEGGCVAFYYYPDTKLSNYTWIWKNKKELMLGRILNDYDIETSVFSKIISRYEYIKRYNINNTEPISEPISETTSNFIDVCRFLNGCHSIEELALKIDLMGI
jgi:hypothetical protein